MLRQKLLLIAPLHHDHQGMELGVRPCPAFQDPFCHPFHVFQNQVYIVEAMVMVCTGGCCDCFEGWAANSDSCS
jgi:hypothetical protein